MDICKLIKAIEKRDTLHSSYGITDFIPDGVMYYDGVWMAVAYIGDTKSIYKIRLETLRYPNTIGGYSDVNEEMPIENFSVVCNVKDEIGKFFTVVLYYDDVEEEWCYETSRLPLEKAYKVVSWKYDFKIKDIETETVLNQPFQIK